MSDDKKNVVDFNQKRKESIEQKRRTFERVVFQEFLGVYSVVDDQGTGFPVKLVDISGDGCQFQLPFSLKAKNQFKSGTEVTLKLYFTKGSYLPCVVTVRHASEYVDQQGDAWLRLGGDFDTSLPTFKALASFINFIYEYAEFSCLDKGESKVYFL
ncbi:MAG TPA: PilZ domain-containing protein [Bacteriovoracaceae bacterium]|nr:PilZ domain-containing protein [Bacteriovoracaceae bacterium]